MTTTADEGLHYLEETAKVKLLPGYTEDYSQVTFCLQEEDHTVGNALRWMIMKDPLVEFCGYSVPHPSEYKINLRIQMYDNASAVDALLRALANLDDLCETIEQAYSQSYQSAEWVQSEDKEMNLAQAKRIEAEAIRKRREAESQAS